MTPDDMLFAIDFGDGIAWIFNNAEVAKCDISPVSSGGRRVEKVIASEILFWLTAGKQRISCVTLIPAIAEFRSERSFEDFETWLEAELKLA